MFVFLHFTTFSKLINSLNRVQISAGDLFTASVAIQVIFTTGLYTKKEKSFTFTNVVCPHTALSITTLKLYGN